MVVVCVAVAEPGGSNPGRSCIIGKGAVSARADQTNQFCSQRAAKSTGLAAAASQHRARNYGEPGPAAQRPEPQQRKNARLARDAGGNPSLPLSPLSLILPCASPSPLPSCVPLQPSQLRCLLWWHLLRQRPVKDPSQLGLDRLPHALRELVRWRHSCAALQASESGADGRGMEHRSEQCVPAEAAIDGPPVSDYASECTQRAEPLRARQETDIAGRLCTTLCFGATRSYTVGTSRGHRRRLRSRSGCTSGRE